MENFRIDSLKVQRFENFGCVNGDLFSFQIQKKSPEQTLKTLPIAYRLKMVNPMDRE